MMTFKPKIPIVSGGGGQEKIPGIYGIFFQISPKLHSLPDFFHVFFGFFSSQNYDTNPYFFQVLLLISRV